ncbi:MAG: hypothetical protein ABI635_00710 [Actinomycetota bacterium]
MPPSAWALETAPNPAVLRLHVTDDLTDRTILTCPPGRAPAPLEALLGLSGIRSLDVHRHRVRLNLEPDADRDGVAVAVADTLREAWGDLTPLPVEELPRAFTVGHGGARAVAESRDMAGDDDVLQAAFAVSGVVEAIAGEGMVLVRLGRLFLWRDVEDAVRDSLDAARG